MRYIKAFGKWYVNLITPYSISIRPFLRKASFITTLALCIITFLWSIAYFLPFFNDIVAALFYTLIALLTWSALIFLLYMITMQFDLDVPLAKHWLTVIPHINFITLFIGYCVIEIIYGRNTPEWDEFYAISLLTLIGWFFSGGLSAIYAQLLTHHQNSNFHRYSN